MKSTLKFLILFVAMVLVAAGACSSNSTEPTPGASATNASTTGGLMCASGQKDCNGVCINTSSDSLNCGECGVQCGTGQMCQVAVCRCQGSLEECGGACINTNANAANCGACGTACATGQVCDRGMCAATCSTGLTDCSGGCTNPLNDPFNCGTCGTACGAGQTCSQGSCVCGDGSPVCNGACTNITNNTAHCGGCNLACAVGQSCVNSVCQGGTVTGGTTTGAASTTGVATTSPTTTTTTTTAGTTTTGVGGATTTADTTTTTGGGTTPPGWWTYAPLSWAGCAWTGIDTVQGSTTTIVPQDFTTGHAAADPYCVSGTVHDNYDSVSLLGFNLAEDPAGADCSYNPADATGEGPPGVSMGGTGIAVNFSKSVASTLRIQIQGPNGATDANDRWCATITEVGGKVFVPYSEFNTECWEGGDGVGYNNEPISAVVFLVPGAAEGNFTDFEYCINGFATGSSADDAPDGGSTGDLMGEIGGPGSTDNDYQRVKVLGGDGKEYIIQNNNWGNAEAYDQTLSYHNNSFKITLETGNGGNGQGVPASFPSIFIGHNGDRQGGNFSTNDSNLPKVVNTITSIPTTFKVAKSGGFNGDYNVSYDVWFSANDPGEAEYNDGISGFLMIWMYKPSAHNPIGWGGGSKGTLSIGGNTFSVYVGNRQEGDASTPPVVNYVNTGAAITSLDFDLKAVIDDAVSKGYGIQSGWYLTDVFGGFEIWNGSGTNGLEATEFTAVVN